MYTNHSGTLCHHIYTLCNMHMPATSACISSCNNSRTCPPQKTVYGASVIIFEGIMAFADKKLLQVSEGYRPLRFSAGHTLTLGFLLICGFFFFLTPSSVVNTSYPVFKICNNWSNDNQIWITVLELIYCSYVLIINILLIYMSYVLVIVTKLNHRTDCIQQRVLIVSFQMFIVSHAVDLILSPSSCFYS